MSATAPFACISQPLSWLTLERHALGEMSGAAAREADEHIAQCAACSAALGSIKADTRVLPPLPAIVRLEPGRASASPPSKDAITPFDSAASPRSTRFARSGSGRTKMIAAGILFAAAAALLLVVLRPKDTATGELSAAVRVKGAGLVNMTLVRERDGAVAFDPADVRDSDRWKVQLTCAPGGGATVEVVVYQPGEPAAVALPAQPFACGNDVVIPGAFRITNGSATICARLDSDALPPLPATPGGQMACRRVAPAAK